MTRHTSVRPAVEVLEAREVPAFGLDTTFAAGGVALDPVGAVRFAFLEGAAAGPNDTVVVAGALVGSNSFGPVGGGRRRLGR